MDSKTDVRGEIKTIPSSNLVLHDMTMMWIKANVDASGMPPEQLCRKYFEILEKMKSARANLNNPNYMVKIV